MSFGSFLFHNKSFLLCIKIGESSEKYIGAVVFNSSKHRDKRVDLRLTIAIVINNREMKINIVNFKQKSTKCQFFIFFRSCSVFTLSSFYFI
jgi:hypothetical protein